MSPRARGARAVRLSDIAAAADVSIQTVSNVVNERGRFCEETRARVLEVVERTGYRPNRAARQLRTRRSRLIGLHLPATQLVAPVLVPGVTERVVVLPPGRWQAHNGTAHDGAAHGGRPRTARSTTAPADCPCPWT